MRKRKVSQDNDAVRVRRNDMKASDDNAGILDSSLGHINDIDWRHAQLTNENDEDIQHVLRQRRVLEARRCSLMEETPLLPSSALSKGLGLEGIDAAALTPSSETVRAAGTATSREYQRRQQGEWQKAAEEQLDRQRVQMNQQYRAHQQTSDRRHQPRANHNGGDDCAVG